MTTFAFFLDAAGTTPVVSPLAFHQASISPTPEDRVVYFGSPVPGRYARPSATASIVVSITGPAADVIALATSAGGLATAVPGAALDLGAEVDGWPLTPIHIRALDDSGVVAQTAFELTTGEIEEWRL